MPLKAQTALAPIPSVSGFGGNAGGAPASGDMGRVITLLEQIARGSSRLPQLPSQERTPVEGPAQETDWQLMFNDIPMGQDSQGNGLLRRQPG